MYADDTTLYCIADDVDTGIAATNKALALVAEWCIMNAMVLHPVKCEAMLLHRSVFIGPMQALTINNVVIKVVKSTRCLGIVIDDKLSWTPHLKETITSFAKKLNLLKSLKFLPTNSLEQFYFKVILPSITYGILVWGNCNKTLFEELNKMHVRAAKIIFRSMTGVIQVAKSAAAANGTHCIGTTNINLLLSHIRTYFERAIQTNY